MNDLPVRHACHPSHPLHCCHIVVTMYTPCQRGWILMGWKCTGCRKTSRAAVMVKIPAATRPLGRET